MILCKIQNLCVVILHHHHQAFIDPFDSLGGFGGHQLFIKYTSYDTITLISMFESTAMVWVGQHTFFRTPKSMKHCRWI